LLEEGLPARNAGKGGDNGDDYPETVGILGQGEADAPQNLSSA